MCALRECVVRANALSLSLVVGAGLTSALLPLVTVAQLVAIAALLSSVYWLWLSIRELEVSVQELLRAARRSLVLAASTMAAPGLTVLALGWRPDGVLPWVCAVPAGLLGFLVAARLLRHELWGELVRLVPLPAWARSKAG